MQWEMDWRYSALRCLRCATARHPEDDGSAGIRQTSDAPDRAGELLVSRTIPPLVAGLDIDFGDRGEYDLKGVPGTW